ncbi:glutathione S-transferase [Gymnopilus junonius]|uniref:glutathione transferase n=1 Tax=Gymnopilus junonius TaxID=109634 RepID=A0A9P5P034_GYMJU|nr:glutathione S-transferase [Gymnopilus junonius]
MVVKLYGAVRSSATRRAAVVLIEKKVPFEFIVIDTPNKEQKTPAYMNKQPFGQIPLLDDEGFLIYESRAIGRYIAEKYASRGPPLIPTDFKEKALFEQAASSEVANFEFHASQIWKEVIKKLRVELKPNQDVVNQLAADFSVKLDVYDSILAKQRYLAGDNITLVDFFPLPYGYSPNILGSDVIECNLIEKRPNVNRWFKEISSRRSWQAVKDGVKSFPQP